MRTLIILVALIAGFISGWREQHKEGSEPVAGMRSDCASNISTDKVASWAAEAVVRAYNFKVGQEAAVTSDTSLFSANGWNGLMSAGRSSGLLGKQGLSADYGVDYVNLQVTGAVDAQQIDAGGNGYPNAWWVVMPVIMGPAGARLAGPMKLELAVECSSAKSAVPLAIDQWIMSVAQ